MEKTSIKIPSGNISPVGVSTVQEAGKHKQAIVQVARKFPDAFFAAFGDANGGTESLSAFASGIDKIDPKVIAIPDGCLGIIVEPVYTLNAQPSAYSDVTSYSFVVGMVLLAENGDTLLPSAIFQNNSVVFRKSYLVAFKDNNGAITGYSNSFFTIADGNTLVFPTLGHKFMRLFVPYESNLSLSFKSFGFKVHFTDKHVGKSWPCNFKPAAQLFKAEY